MIREATENDIDSIVKLGQMTVDEGRYSHIGYKPEKVKKFVNWYLTSPNHLLLVSEIKGRICGFFFGFITDFYFSDVLMASEELWYMAPEHRGKRDGVVMIKKFIDWAKKKNVCELSAGVSLGVDNETAGKVLKAMGFVTSGSNYKMRL